MPSAPWLQRRSPNSSWGYDHMDLLGGLIRILRAAFSRLAGMRGAATPKRCESPLPLDSHDASSPSSEKVQEGPPSHASYETDHGSENQTPAAEAIDSRNEPDQTGSGEYTSVGSTSDAPPSASADNAGSHLPASTIPVVVEPIKDSVRGPEPETPERPGSQSTANIEEPDPLLRPLPEPSEMRRDGAARPAVAAETEAETGEDGIKPRKRRLSPEAHPRSNPQPRSQISHEPFSEHTPTPPPSEYARWNEAIARHCLLADGNEAEDVYLAITPRILAAALSEAGDEMVPPETAQLHFVEAVSTMYREMVLTHPRRLRILRREGPDGAPECTAFLALSVLAAYEMHADEESSAAAYYVRLAELLRSNLVGGRPNGFELEEFEALWHFVRAWLKEKHGRNLAMPGPEAGLRRFVALPLAHVPLRKVDIERLPDFFVWAAYEPYSKVPRDRLDVDLAKWSRGRSVFTNAGMAALADERRRAVLAQITNELECWDGSQTDSLGRRTTVVEIFLEPVRRVPELFFLPRRPAAFPNVFDDGVHTFDAGEGGWYSPLPIDPADGADLHAGFSWESSADGVRLAMRRAGASVIALAPSEFSGFISHRGLVLGAPTAVLCHEDVAGPTADYLTRVTGQRCQPANYPNMPAGWRLFTAVKPIQRAPVPDGLEDLEVDCSVGLVPIGGLRLGRRWAWLSGAPPKLLIAGADSATKVTIDGEAAQIGADGTISDEGRLTQPGAHIIEVGRLRRRVEILEAQVPTQSAVISGRSDQHTVALPRGRWAVVGASPGESILADGGQWEGTVLLCPFRPVWAVSVGAGPGATVLSLTDSPPAPAPFRLAPGKRAHRSAEAWASCIYNAAIRRPLLGAAFSASPIPRHAEIWRMYMESARQVKRTLRARRR